MPMEKKRYKLYLAYLKYGILFHLLNSKYFHLQDTAMNQNL